MKTNKDYILRNIAGEYILIPTGAATEDFNGMINLSEVAAFIWQNLDKAMDEADLIRMVLREYDVEEATARHDVMIFLESLKKYNMAE